MEEQVVEHLTVDSFAAACQLYQFQQSLKLLVTLRHKVLYGAGQDTWCCIRRHITKCTYRTEYRIQSNTVQDTKLVCKSSYQSFSDPSFITVA